MLQNLEDCFGLIAASNMLSQLLHRMRFALMFFEMRNDLALQVDHSGGRLLSSLHSGLVVGVGVDQNSVNSNGTLIKRDQFSEDRKSVV